MTVEKSMGGNPNKNTPIIAQLKRAQLDSYVNLFTKQCFTDIAQLGDTEKDVIATIQAVCGAEVKIGIRQRLLGLWRDVVTTRSEVEADEKKKKDAVEKKKDADNKQKEAEEKKDNEAAKKKEKDNKIPPKLPDLPKGTKIDLSKPTFTFDNETFKTPETIVPKTANNDYKTAFDLSSKEWLALASRNRILYGTNLDSAFSPKGSDGSAGALHAGLVWEVPENNDWLGPKGNAHIESTLDYSSNYNNLVHSRLISAELNFSCPFVSGKASYDRSERDAKSSKSKTLRMTGKWMYPKAVLRLEYCTAVSDQLLTALKEALKADGLKAKAEALDRVFNDFGHVFPTEIVLGGMMYFEHEKSTNENVNEKEITNSVKAAVSIKVGQAGGGAGLGYTEGDSHSDAAKEIAQRVSWTAVGGNETLNGNPAEWAKTTADPMNWAVIHRRKPKHIIEWLPEDIKLQIVEIWSQSLKVMWGQFYVPPRDYTYPDLNARPFTISASLETASPLLSCLGVYLGKQQAQKRWEELYIAQHKLWKNSAGAANKRALEWDDWYKKWESESHIHEVYPYQQTNGVDKPNRLNQLWRLVYSGARQSISYLDGGVARVCQLAPLYWIVADIAALYPEFEKEGLYEGAGTARSPYGSRKVLQHGVLEHELTMIEHQLMELREALLPGAEIWSRKLWAAVPVPKEFAHSDEKSYMFVSAFQPDKNAVNLAIPTLTASTARDSSPIQLVPADISKTVNICKFR